MTNTTRKYHPHTRDELRELVRNSAIQLGEIDISKVTDLTRLFAVPSGTTTTSAPEQASSQASESATATSSVTPFGPRTDFTGLDTWDVSHVTSMREMFTGCSTFNEDLRAWDVSRVTDMSGMFTGCTSFNQPLVWVTQEATLTHEMFAGCTALTVPPLILTQQAQPQLLRDLLVVVTSLQPQQLQELLRHATQLQTHTSEEQELATPQVDTSTSTTPEFIAEESSITDTTATPTPLLSSSAAEMEAAHLRSFQELFAELPTATPDTSSQLGTSGMDRFDEMLIQQERAQFLDPVTTTQEPSEFALWESTPSTPLFLDSTLDSNLAPNNGSRELDTPELALDTLKFNDLEADLVPTTPESATSTATPDPTPATTSTTIDFNAEWQSLFGDLSPSSSPDELTGNSAPEPTPENSAVSTTVNSSSWAEEPARTTPSTFMSWDDSTTTSNAPTADSTTAQNWPSQFAQPTPSTLDPDANMQAQLAALFGDTESGDSPDSAQTVAQEDASHTHASASEVTQEQVLSPSIHNPTAHSEALATSATTPTNELNAPSSTTAVTQGWNFDQVVGEVEGASTSEQPSGDLAPATPSWDFGGIWGNIPAWGEPVNPQAILETDNTSETATTPTNSSSNFEFGELFGNIDNAVRKDLADETFNSKSEAATEFSTAQHATTEADLFNTTNLSSTPEQQFSNGELHSTSTASGLNFTSDPFAWETTTNNWNLQEETSNPFASAPTLEPTATPELEVEVTPAQSSFTSATVAESSWTGGGFASTTTSQEGSEQWSAPSSKDGFTLNSDTPTSSAWQDGTISSEVASDYGATDVGAAWGMSPAPATPQESLSATTEATESLGDVAASTTHVSSESQSAVAPAPTSSWNLLDELLSHPTPATDPFAAPATTDATASNEYTSSLNFTTPATQESAHANGDDLTPAPAPQLETPSSPLPEHAVLGAEAHSELAFDTVGEALEYLSTARRTATGQYQPHSVQELRILLTNSAISLGDLDLSQLKSLHGAFANIPSERGKLPPLLAQDLEQHVAQVLVQDSTYPLPLVYDLTPNWTGIERLDLSQIEDLSYCFAYQFGFNNRLLTWKVDHVTSLRGMFRGCINFRANLNHWNTAQVQDLSEVFAMCYHFNQPVTWDTSSCTNMHAMFYSCPHFNQRVNFATQQVTDMSQMFMNCMSFNQDIPFDTAKVTDMSQMFSGCRKFNGTVAFQTTEVRNLREMFKNCAAFDQTVNFATANVTDMAEMFANCSSFIGKEFRLSNTRSVQDFTRMFADCSQFAGQLMLSFNVVEHADGLFAGCRIPDTNSFTISTLPPANQDLGIDLQHLHILTK